MVMAAAITILYASVGCATATVLRECQVHIGKVPATDGSELSLSSQAAREAVFLSAEVDQVCWQNEGLSYHRAALHMHTLKAVPMGLEFCQKMCSICQVLMLDPISWS